MRCGAARAKLRAVAPLFRHFRDQLSQAPQQQASSVLGHPVYFPTQHGSPFESRPVEQHSLRVSPESKHLRSFAQLEHPFGSSEPVQEPTMGPACPVTAATYVRRASHAAHASSRTGEGHMSPVWTSPLGNTACNAAESSGTIGSVALLGIISMAMDSTHTFDKMTLRHGERARGSSMAKHPPGRIGADATKSS